MLKKYEYLTVFFAGANAYSLIEILWRGYTHPSMALVGGICFLMLYLIGGVRFFRSGAASFAAACVVGGIVITLTEFVAGVILNIVLGLGVWDYSDVRGNILGQICPQFSLAWTALSAPALLLSGKVRRFFEFIGNGQKYEEKEQQKIRT